MSKDIRSGCLSSGANTCFWFSPTFSSDMLHSRSKRVRKPSRKAREVLMQQEDCSRLQHEVLNRVRLRSRVAREDEMHDDQPRRRLAALCGV